MAPLLKICGIYPDLGFENQHIAAELGSNLKHYVGLSPKQQQKQRSRQKFILNDGKDSKTYLLEVLVLFDCLEEK